MRDTPTLCNTSCSLIARLTERANKWRRLSGRGEVWRVTYGSVHFLLSEAADVSDGAGSPLLELDALQALVQVERVVAAGRLQFCLLSHLN